MTTQVLIPQVAIAPSEVPLYITTDEAKTAPNTMVVHVLVAAGLAERNVDLCIPNDGNRCRPKIDSAIAKHLPGWSVRDWRDINSKF